VNSVWYHLSLDFMNNVILDGLFPQWPNRLREVNLNI